MKTRGGMGGEGVGGVGEKISKRGFLRTGTLHIARLCCYVIYQLVIIHFIRFSLTLPHSFYTGGF